MLFHEIRTIDWWCSIRPFTEVRMTLFRVKVVYKFGIAKFDLHEPSTH